jgi:alpha-amylase
MPDPRSIHDLDFDPIPGKTYWNCRREWREEFIYFLMVDRFHDGAERHPRTGPARARAARPDASRLRRFCGGTLRGITRNLDYIHELGCTAVWLSPVFENDHAPDRDAHSYHGYAIRNYLAIDPRFGTTEDLIELVDQAHRREIRVFLDAVANHCGDVWYYPGDVPYEYSDDGRQFELAGWRHPDFPAPAELRNPEYFHRRGQIRRTGWDRIPETQWGDFFGLKGFNNDEDPAGLELQRIMIDAHRHWLRVADIDGYRMDAVKHMGEVAVARFCQAMREYAYLLGKREFFLFGELVGGDDAIHRYTGPSTVGHAGGQTILYGLSSVLDFPLWWVLPDVLKGFQPPQRLFERYDALHEHGLQRGELGHYLVTFADNHDQIGQDWKRRIASGADDLQVVATLGYLICAVGTPCIYYGTEQGLSGEGAGDEHIREPLFDLDDPTRDDLDRECRIYRGIAAIARIHHQQPALRFGRMYFRETSSDGRRFTMPHEHPCTIAFSRMIADDEVLVAINTSTTARRAEHVIVDAHRRRPGDRMRFLYRSAAAGPDLGDLPVLRHPDAGNGSRFVRLELEPMEIAILA